MIYRMRISGENEGLYLVDVLPRRDCQPNIGDYS